MAKKKNQPTYLQVIPSINSVLDNLTVAVAAEAARLATKAQRQALNKDERRALSEYSQAIVRVATEQDRQRQKTMLAQLSEGELLELLQQIAPKLLGDGYGK